ncbi:MAG: endonuclease III domain-containing protein [Deltaproteobacteria bacterium]|nr:endonuclease III domain-containing protein [Deltaproteobacteria bacterium]
MSTAESLRELYKILLGSLGPQGWWPAPTALEVMVGAVLTQNTAWKNVTKALDNLRAAGCLREAGACLNLSPGALAELIRPSGYYNQKEKRLRALLELVNREYGGDPAYMASRSTGTLREELLALKGIGPETADSILCYALGHPVFVVDAYTFRILARHGMAEAPTSYDELQSLFSDNLPPDNQLFNEFHALLVRLGHEYCKKSKPRCAVCPARDWVQPPDLEEEF